VHRRHKVGGINSIGDSVGDNVLGLPNTVPVTMQMMVHHVRAASAGARRALLVADMPFGSFQSGVRDAVLNAVELMKAGAEAIKLEGPYVDEIQAIIRAGIPAMRHVGMTPQSVHSYGGFRVQGKNADSAQVVMESAASVAAAGAFAIVLELIPSGLAATITDQLEIPTIGIGAGQHCDGQIQVFHDIMGLNKGVHKHAKVYSRGRLQFVRGLKKYSSEVRKREFPDQEHSF
jgi:3-methyl-2-oxobutanoate hydroxymethyltransferase